VNLRIITYTVDDGVKVPLAYRLAYMKYWSCRIQNRWTCMFNTKKGGAVAIWAKHTVTFSLLWTKAHQI